MTAFRRGNLSVSKDQAAGTGNINDGWIGGGNSLSIGTIS